MMAKTCSETISKRSNGRNVAIALGMVAIMMASMAFIIAESEDGDADSALGTYTGGTNRSSSTNPYTGIDCTAQSFSKASGTIYVAVGSTIDITANTSGGMIYRVGSICAGMHGLSFTGTEDKSGKSSGVYGTVTKGSFEIQIEGWNEATYETTTENAPYDVNIPIKAIEGYSLPDSSASSSDAQDADDSSQTSDVGGNATGSTETESDSGDSDDGKQTDLYVMAGVITALAAVGIIAAWRFL